DVLDVSDPSSSDVDLHVRVVQGDEAALILIDERYQPLVVGWARNGGLPVSEAEAAWNDALLSFWQKAASITPMGSIKPYLFGVVRNKVADYHRSKDTRMHSRDVTDLPAPQVSSLYPKVADRPLTARLAGCLDLLTNDHRTAIDLVVLQGMQVKDVAEVMGAQPNTVSKWTSRALEQLRKCMEDRDE